MPIQLKVADAQRRFAELLDRARLGEEFVLTEGGIPIVRISPAGTGTGNRVFGEFAGKISMTDDFASPLPLQERADWER